MKTMAALLIGLSATTVLSLPAAAENFNDQSPVPVVSAPGIVQVSPAAAMAEPDRFNDRNVDYIVASPIGSHTAFETVMAFDMHFNMK